MAMALLLLLLPLATHPQPASTDLFRAAACFTDGDACLICVRPNASKGDPIFNRDCDGD
ncbi:hypothetical protein DAI22_11g244100 [Oryza sativa Japonica Group]|nr:hypothetical protein DAI22_11g244100 [Oryza sativa Japonica Group]